MTIGLRVWSTDTHRDSGLGTGAGYPAVAVTLTSETWVFTECAVSTVAYSLGTLRAGTVVWPREDLPVALVSAAGVYVEKPGLHGPGCSWSWVKCQFQGCECCFCALCVSVPTSLWHSRQQGLWLSQG